MQSHQLQRKVQRLKIVVWNKLVLTVKNESLQATVEFSEPQTETTVKALTALLMLHVCGSTMSQPDFFFVYWLKSWPFFPPPFLWLEVSLLSQLSIQQSFLILHNIIEQQGAREYQRIVPPGFNRGNLSNTVEVHSLH